MLPIIIWSYGNYSLVKKTVSVWGAFTLKLRHLDSEVKYILYLPLNHTDSIKLTWHWKTERSAIYRTILFLGNMLRSDESRRVIQPAWPIAKDNLTKPWHALLPDLQRKVSYFLPLADDTWLTALLWGSVVNVHVVWPCRRRAHTGADVFHETVVSLTLCLHSVCLGDDVASVNCSCLGVNKEVSKTWWCWSDWSLDKPNIYIHLSLLINSSEQLNVQIKCPKATLLKKKKKSNEIEESDWILLNLSRF